MSGNASAVAAAPAAPEIERMPVKIAHLDTLLGLTGEIIIAASNLSILQRQLANGQAKADKETVDLIKQASLSTGRISSDLHHLVMDIRMVAIRDTFLRFRRLVRDIAKKRGRQVDLEIVGEDTLVDKTVAERLYEPLAHQIRNAIDHGLEDPLDRQHAGKPPTGVLTLGAYKKEEFTYVYVADDGQGLDESRIRLVAVEKGHLSDTQARALSVGECLDMIMRPGFSTTAEATEISGRGVGMDVVKSTVESLGGEVLVETRPGHGTTFTYKIPELSAVNITDAVVIRAGDGYFAVPVGNVVATMAITPKQVNTTLGGQGETILYLGDILPLHDLCQVLGGAPIPDDGSGTVPVLIVEAKNGRIACRVSEFIRPQKLVLIPLPDGFTPKGVAGTTILGGTQLGMIVEPFELVALASGTSLDDVPPGGFADASDADAPAAAESAPPAAAPAGGGTPVPRAAAAVAAPPAPANAGETGALEGGGVAEEFFVEIQNILQELNEDIFQLEKEPGDMARINTIFRHFHSIKGNFMMTGFHEVGAFVHQLESVLDQMREKTLEVNQEIIDLLLDAVKNLENGLNLIRLGQKYVVEDENLLQALARYKRAPHQILPREDVGGDDVFHFSPFGTLLFNAKRADPECRVFQSRIRLKPTFQDPSLVAYLIIKRLTRIGEVIDTAPALDRIENGLVGAKFKVMFATRLSSDEVGRYFARQLARYFSVESFDNLAME